MSASERRAQNPYIGHAFEELVKILRETEPQDQKGVHAYAMHAILIRFPGQDIKVMNRALGISSNTHESDAIHLAIEFVMSAREANQGFHIDSLLSRQSH